MNIDERLEALAQSVELLTLDVRSLEKLVDRSIAAQQETNTRVVSSIEGLLRVVQSHENRLSRLEGTAD